METLDEKLERLYGPQKTKFSSPVYKGPIKPIASANSGNEDLAFEAGWNGWPKIPKDGKEMAEILLGHELY